MNFLKRFFGGGKAHSSLKQIQAPRETPPTPTTPPAGDQGGGNGSAQALTDDGYTSPDNNMQLDANAYFRRGLEKSHSDLDGCIVDLTKAIELKPDFPLAFFNRGEARYSKGDFDGAITDHTEAIELKPDIDNAYCKRGNAKQLKGDLNGAIADYTEAIDLRPDDVSAYHNRGKAKQAKGDLDGAIADYTKAIALEPNFALAYGNRGLARKANGDLDGAIADQTKAIQLKTGVPLSITEKTSSCPECGAPKTDRMEERGYQITISGVFAEYSCPGCKKNLTFQFEYRDKETGIQVLCGSCKTVAYVPPPVWCKTCGKGLTTGWQNQISIGREADKAAREFNDPGAKHSRALARDLMTAHGKLRTIHFTSPAQDYEIHFDFADGKRIRSGANVGDIVGFAFGYLGGGPTRLQIFLDEMGISISEEEVGKIKSDTTAEVTGSSLRFVKEALHR